MRTERETIQRRELPPRIASLKRDLLGAEPSVCFERARILTRSYHDTEGEPQPLRRAKALRDVFSRMPIFLRPGEMLLGQRASRLGARSVYPEFHLNGLRPEEIPADVRDYWQGRTLGDEVRATHAPELRKVERELGAGYVTGAASGFGHVIVDYPKVLRVGFAGIIDEADQQLASCPAEDQQGRDFLEAVKIAAAGIIRWAHRYAELADQQALACPDPQRAAELREIAEVCRRVPAEPARTFHEALQSFWFTHLGLHIEQFGWSISAGRFDQYMQPFYRADVDSGRLGRREAWELLLGLWVKFMENVGSRVRQTVFQNLTLGGRHADGRDESNELSGLCLDATAATGFNQPALSVRWHANMDAGFREHVCRTIRHGLGMPALFNDEVVIDALVRNGVPPDEAVGYGIVGCVEACVPGRQQGVTAGGHLNCAKALELALNDGRSTVSGEQLGPRTGPAGGFRSFDDLWKAYVRQVEHLGRLNIEAAEAAGRWQKLRAHCPLESSLLDDGLARRRDLVDGGTRHSLAGISVFGSTNTCDAMLAIRRCVCEEGRWSWQELADALAADFKGCPEMRRQLRQAGPRFGNDRPEADELANRINAVHAEFFQPFTNPRGGRYTCGLWPVEGHVHSGRWTGATADGRNAGEPLADGVGACQGADRSGPTALLLSVARLRHAEHWPAGNTCNIKFARKTLAGEEGLRRLAALIDTYMTLGGQQLQVNVVDRRTLEDARKHPEKHGGLVVRVAGFSAYFVDLGRATQDEIISRTAHGV